MKVKEYLKPFRDELERVAPKGLNIDATMKFMASAVKSALRDEFNGTVTVDRVVAKVTMAMRHGYPDFEVNGHRLDVTMEWETYVHPGDTITGTVKVIIPYKVMSRLEPK